jgi:hypothetical protein
MKTCRCGAVDFCDLDEVDGEVDAYTEEERAEGCR